MNLMQGERILFESPSKVLTLTTHRVRYEMSTAGGAVLKSIMLEELASCSMTRTSNPILLVLAAICFILGFISATSGREEGAFIIGIVLALVFVVAYFSTRRQVVALASAGATIYVAISGLSQEAIRQFIDQAEAAKNSRYLLGSGIYG